MRVVRRHLFLLPICGGSAQVQFACEQTSRRSQTRIVSLNRERGELESGATAALRQGAFVGTGLFRRLGQVDEQERGERGLFCAHWATCRACRSFGRKLLVGLSHRRVFPSLLSPWYSSRSSILQLPWDVQS